MKYAIFLLAFVLSFLPAHADFRELLPMLGDVKGYSSLPAQGSTILLPKGKLDMVSRSYSSASSSFIITVYSGNDISVLDEHGLKVGNVTTEKNVNGKKLLTTPSGVNKGYLTLSKEGSPLTVVMEFKGMKSDRAEEILNGFKFYK